MKRGGVSLAIALILAGLIAGPAASHQTLRMGFAIQRTGEFDYELGRCVLRGATWVQELGASGVNRLRFRFNLHNSYDPFESSYAAVFSTGWIYSATFPDDARSLYVTFHYSLGHWDTTLYKAREVAIGERPSFWQTDRKLSRSVRDVICNAGPTVA